jgi:hypothetical protein
VCATHPGCALLFLTASCCARSLSEDKSPEKRTLRCLSLANDTYRLTDLCLLQPVQARTDLRRCCMLLCCAAS